MIKRIEIQNYRSCFLTVFEPHPHLSVLIGPNGSGKTNLFNAITLLNKLSDESIHYPHKERPTGQCKLKVWFEFEGKKAILTAMIETYTDENNNDEIVSSIESWYLKDFTGSKEILNYPIYFFKNMGESFIKLINYKQTYSVNDMIIKIPDDAIKAFKLIYRYIENIKYYCVSKFTNPANCPVSFEIEENSLYRRIANTRGHEKFLYDLYSQYKAKNNKIYQQYIDIIGPSGIGLIDKIGFQKIPTSSMDITVRSGGKTQKQRRDKILVIPQFKIGRNVLSPSQLSEGTFKTITLLFYIITETSSLLLIEEPEVCIHHGLLSSIIEIIKDYSRDKQIFISTHSDFILDYVAPENVFKVSLTKERGTEVTSIHKSKSPRELKALREYLDTVGSLGEYWKHGDLE